MAKPISVQDALDHIGLRGRDAVGKELIALENALGRRLAVDVFATGPWPATDRSAMDGFACATAGAGVDAGQTFPVVGEALAGHPFDLGLEAGQAVRIMTGAVLPADADTVVRVEDTSGFEGGSVTVRSAVPSGASIRPRGSEIAEGDLLLARGTRMRAAEVGAAAVLGMAEVPVFERPRVAILSTGDEIVPIDRDTEPHQVRDSNAWSLAAQVIACGAEPLRLGICADEAGALRGKLADALDCAEIVLTIGGVSKGTHDLVHGTLCELGISEVFHGVAIKPGKPLYFGEQSASGPFVFGLPGNPASAFTTFWLFVRPLLLRLAGETDPCGWRSVRLGGSGFRRNWRAQAIPARLVQDGAELVAELRAARPSGDPFGVCEGDGVVLIPGETEPGSVERAEFLAFDAQWS